MTLMSPLAPIGSLKLQLPRRIWQHGKKNLNRSVSSFQKLSMSLLPHTFAKSKGFNTVDVPSEGSSSGAIV